MSGLYHPPPDASSPFRQRLLNPRWDAIEAALGRPVPGVLREIYGAPEALLRGHFYLSRPDGQTRAWLDLFLPMDEEALHPYGLTLPAGAVAFADDEHGDPYFYIPDATEYGDGPVFRLERNQASTDRLADSLAEFLRWPRQYQH
jgi:hypothetical protein